VASILLLLLLLLIMGGRDRHAVGMRWVQRWQLLLLCAASVPIYDVRAAVGVQLLQQLVPGITAAAAAAAVAGRRLRLQRCCCCCCCC
jgi:drug/metabolite transporter (DMT)-like permease